ncbi:MAG: TIGR03790 family protein [Planctomycetes bacterium]|nr:TIGR03790 family protein [Planctomycetota bacterium]
MNLPRRKHMVIAGAAIALAALASSPPTARAGGGPAETVVIVNTESADSRRVADAYVKARQIPPSHVLEVKCTTAFEVPVAEFVRDIADPLRTLLAARHIEDRIRFVVLTQGMPIRAKTPSGDVSTAAALALLHSPVCGANQTGIQPPTRSPAYKGGLPLPPTVECDRFLHVAALLSTTADEALGLIERSVASDGTAPKEALFLFQDANGAASTRNAYYDAARTQLEALGAKTEHVPAGADKAVNRKRVIGYMAGGAYSALTPDGVKTNEYLPGAICDHLQSYGSVPQNFDLDPKNDTQFPVIHMVRAGITAVHGAVQEPYTIAFPDPDLFTAYLQGATVGETFDLRLPIAYWMNLVLGDPLCAPYADRPKVTLTGAPSGPWTGTVKLVAKAPGAKRIAVYVNGSEAAAGDGESLDASINTTLFPDGAQQVLVEATGAGEWEPRGWTVVAARLANPSLHVAERPAKFRGALRVALSRAPAGDEKPSLALTADGAPVAGSSRLDGATLVFEPQGAVPPGALEASVNGAGDSVRWSVSAAATSLTVDGSQTLAAGESASLKVVVKRADGSPAAGWRGRAEVRLSDPPVRVSSSDVVAGADGGFELPLRFVKAGAVSLRLTLPEDGVDATVKLTVTAGPADHATSPLSRVPLGQPCDVIVDVVDLFGNRADSYEGELRIAFPSDPYALVPGPAKMTKADRGRVVFRDVVLTRGGQQPLVISDGGGKQWSQATEGLEAVHNTVRSWFVASPFRGDDATKALSPDGVHDLAKDADRDGCVAGGKLWRRLRAGGDDVQLPSPGTKDGDAVVATTFVKATSATKVRLLGAAATRIVVILDGKVVSDGAPKAPDPKGKREPIADVDLSEGMHRLVVIATRKDRGAAFSLEIDDGAGKHADQVLVLGAATEDAPATFVASGRVRRGGGINGAKVHVTGSDGTVRSTATGPDGTWFVTGLPPGEIEVRAEWTHPLAPAGRKTTIESSNATDLDFVAEDKSPPTVKLDGIAPRFGRTLLVEPAIEDDDAVKEVRLLLDGIEYAKLTAAPWRLQADVGAKARGKHEVVVVALDPSGNEGRSAPQTITLIDDAKGPTLKLSGLANNADVKKKTDVAAAVSDDLPIASVRFRLDGKDLGAPRTAAPYTAEVDPKGLAAGPHALSVTARDLDGNETLVEVKFRTK